MPKKTIELDIDDATYDAMCRMRPDFEDRIKALWAKPEEDMDVEEILRTRYHKKELLDLARLEVHAHEELTKMGLGDLLSKP